MMKLKLIALFLSMLMVVQMVPVPAIGQALGQNQWTEELPHGEDCDGKVDNTANFINPFLPPVNYTTHNYNYFQNKALAYMHICEQIPFNHSTEVVTPPPDAAL